MKLLADACVERAIVVALRAAGHDVEYMLEISPRMGDEEVLQKAQAEHRALLTNDVGFGERASKASNLAIGIIVLRFKTEIADEKVARVLDQIPVVASHLGTHFAILSERGTRLIPLRRPAQETGEAGKGS